MNETDIAKLETRIDELITVCEQLRSENTALRAREGSLVEEKEQLHRLLCSCMLLHCS